ncbi:MAG: inorganic diphosphatase, partial [Syntrophomonadaceae bacterium]
MKASPIGALKPDVRGETVRVVIETPKHGPNKFAFDPEIQAFTLSAVLPVGITFPFDFGFIPKTKGGDGDPLDVLLLMDEPAFPGCVVEVRLLGVIEATQKKKGKKVRNDRLIGVAAESHLHRDLGSIKDLDPRLIDEIEAFFRSYHELDGERFEALGRHGPKKARALLEEGLRAA